ncbi:MAG: B12-binding domain-containing radical SAM protein [Nitrososphaerota archaeon]|jgi:magnesium-protoporphyrin IX monomethyl ester (oxidative) cyclase|nr:B12-binding domain-containing radical SAM protein [Nitrososphaerota archaeon]
MKILLINPPQTFYPNSEPPAGNLPLGLMYLAAVLDKAGYTVEILDAFMTDSKPKKNGDTITVGLSFSQIETEIQQRKPDIVGVSGPFTSQITNTLKVCKLTKKVNPNILTIVGGPHASTVPKEFLEKNQTVDITVIGEGEHTLLEIVKHFENKKPLNSILGIVYRQNNTVIVNEVRPFLENLDELPYPAYHLVNMEHYLSNKEIGYRSFQKRAISMVTSRGCPFNCCFCSVHLHMGKKFRAHSAQYVLNHIQHVVDKYNVKNIFFEDDNLTFDLNRFETICDGLIERRIKIGWETPNGVRADYLNTLLLKKMKQAGVVSIFVGVESGDQEVLNKIVCKSLKLDMVAEFAKNAKRLGLKTGAFYIIGFPGEKKENMQRTVDFALMLKQKYDVGMHLFTATPTFGTKLYEQCKTHNYLTADLSCDTLGSSARQPLGHSLIHTNDFTPQEVKEIAQQALKKYKKLSLINLVKNPKKALQTIYHQPQLLNKYLKNLFS